MVERYESLYRSIQRVRRILPPAITLVVVAFELAVRPYIDQPWAFWLQLGFYGLVGPLVTWLTLDWIAWEVLERGRAEAALAEANRRLEAVRQVLRRVLVAENLEEAIRAVVFAVQEGLGGEVALELEGYREATPGFRDGAPDETAITLVRTQGRLILSGVALDRGFLELLAGEVDSVLEAAIARTRDLLTLFEVDQALRAEANLERMLEGLIERIVRWAGGTGGAVYLLDEDGLLVPRAARGMDLLPHPFPPEGQWEAALKHAVVLDEGHIAVPLRGQAPVGVLVVAGPAETLKARLPFLQLLANQVALAVRNAQAYLRAEELAINEERSRIAREIHDGIAQALAFMALKLDLATRILDRDRDRALSEIQAVKDTLRQQIREVRRSIFALRPIDLERYGFVESVRRYAAAFGEQAGLRVRLLLAEKVNLSQASELVLFRVLQEVLTNIAKHAAARTVTVRLEPLGDKGARLEVVDDGRGFDPAEVRAQGLGGFGLVQMEERVCARGGRFEVESAPGRGTRVVAELPYCGGWDGRRASGSGAQAGLGTPLRRAEGWVRVWHLSLYKQSIFG